MKVENIRNVAILGHQSSGKTTLVEALAFASGLISQKGEVEKKTTLSDYSPDEQNVVARFKPQLFLFVIMTIRLTF